MALTFDANYYLQQRPDVFQAYVATGGSTGLTWEQFAEQHYDRYGRFEGSNPNAVFNTNEYLAANPDVAAAGVNPLQHYLNYGVNEGRAPNASFTKFADFDSAKYLAANPDLEAAGIDTPNEAYAHYVLYGQFENRPGVDVPPTAFELTNGTDVASATSFTAGLVYTPGGNDRINSLQDEDKLTGLGDNATLDAELGNANDNGSTTVTPEMTNISTLNLKFTGSGGAAVNQLDLQDTDAVSKAININRISDGVGSGVTIDNIKNVPVDLKVANSGQVNANIDFEFTDAAVSKETDSVNLTLSNVQSNRISVQERAGGVVDQGIETINLKSEGSANSTNELRAEDLQTLNITGDQSLQVGARAATLAPAALGGQVEADRYANGLTNTDGSLTKIDASAFTGNLDLTLGSQFNANKDGTSGQNIHLDVLGGKGDDTIRLVSGTVVGGTDATRDNIDGGEGKNTLVVLGTAEINAAGTAAAPVANVTNFQALEVRTGHDAGNGIDYVNVDANAFDKLETIYVRNEGQQQDGAGVWRSTSEQSMVNLLNLTAAQASAVTVAHGTTGNNSTANNRLNIDVAAGVTAAAVTITDGVNTDPRFNFVLAADSDLTANAAGNPTELGNKTNTVANLTLTDNDTESNTVALAEVAKHVGTVTVKGSSTGFLNLDTTTAGANGGLYGYDVSGNVAGDSKAIADHSATGGQVRFQGATFDSSEYAGSVVVRVDTARDATGTETATGGQNIKFGAGNDTVIFDKVNDARAGLTFSDTVSGGEGNDTLAIDGNFAGEIALSASEWTNVSGFENIRLVGNAAGTYRLTLTNELIAANKDADGFLNIINDNNPVNDAAGGSDAAAGAQESDVVLDGRSLSATSRFTYNGEEGATRTNDRFILSDANLNGGNKIDGGAVDNLATTNSVANADILEVRNAAVVTVGDLANISNVGRIHFNNDLAITQTLNLQLNDTVVDAMVDSYHTSTAAEAEKLYIRAHDTSVASIAGAALNIDAQAITGRSILDIQSDQTLAAADTISVASNVGSASGHTIDIGDVDTNDVLTFVGAAGEQFANVPTTVTVNGNVNSANIVIQNASGLATVSHSVEWNTGDTINLNAGGVVTSYAVASANFNTTYNGGAGDDTIIGNNGNNAITGGAGADVMTGGAGADVMTGNGGADVFNYNSLATVSAQTGITLATADTITDFTSGTDTIKIGTAGSATNYVEAAAAADFATAQVAADTAMNGTVGYYLTSTAADGGLLFVDSNLDGTADAVIKLTGITDANFAFTDITA